MRPAARIALVTLGLAAAVYRTASLTGEWLGSPPWWERAAPMSSRDWLRKYYPGDRDFGPGPVIRMGREPPGEYAHWVRASVEAPLVVEPREGREWISGGVVAAGVAPAGFGAWPRRRRPNTTTSSRSGKV